VKEERGGDKAAAASTETKKVPVVLRATVDEGSRAARKSSGRLSGCRGGVNELSAGGGCSKVWRYTLVVGQAFTRQWVPLSTSRGAHSVQLLSTDCPGRPLPPWPKEVPLALLDLPMPAYHESHTGDTENNRNTYLHTYLENDGRHPRLRYLGRQCTLSLSGIRHGAQSESPKI
jgi:hypothetical protein